MTVLRPPASTGKARQPAVDLSNLHDSLTWLAANGYISGSWALGNQRPDSDIDVHLALTKVRKLKAMLNEQGVKWSSPMTGCITWYPEGAMVEVSDLFPRYRSTVALDVRIMGIRFRR